MQRLKSFSVLNQWRKSLNCFSTVSAQRDTHHFQDEILVEGRAFSRAAILNRPSKLNAVTTSMADRLQRLYQSWEDNSQIGFVTMKGSGRAFCSGADMGMMLHAKKLSGRYIEAKSGYYGWYYDGWWCRRCISLNVPYRN